MTDTYEQVRAAPTFNGSWDTFNPDVLREFKPWNK